MIMTGSGEAKAARDGRRWTLRPARPTDGRALARLFAEVRREGTLADHDARIGQRAIGVVLDQRDDPRRRASRPRGRADGEIIGNVLVSVDRGVATEHIGVLSITIAEPWRDVGIGTELVAAAQRWVVERGLRKLSLGVFPENARAIAVYEKRGFVREGLRHGQYRSGSVFRDEVLMAWFRMRLRTDDHRDDRAQRAP
jgi:RimJ/RimL family protein N-acetyltransferase